MSIFRQHAYARGLIYWTSYDILLIAIFCTVSPEAFSTCSFTHIKRLNKICLNRKQYINKDANCLKQLTRVAQIPPSNATPDRTTFADSVTVNNINLDDEKYIHDNCYDELEDLSTMDTMQIKNRLLDLLPKMTGTSQEYKKVESYVNILEDRYAPVQTLDFLNMAMAGEWQLLFSTNIGASTVSYFRLRELYQRIYPNGFNGTITNEAAWDLIEDHDDETPGTSFNAHGSFSIKCSYSINQGGRMILELNDHAIKLSKGSVVPKNVQRLVGFLYRAIPAELFDPNDHAMDTTYLDSDLRIVRIAGPKFEAVRNIFIRRGSTQINPSIMSV